MNRNKTLLTIISSAIFLSGCSSINKVADNIGINFWSHSAKKAPCKSASIIAEESVNQPCVTKALPKLNDDEVLKLRGRYTI